MKITGQREKRRSIHKLYKCWDWKWGCSVNLYVIMTPNTHWRGKEPQHFNMESGFNTSLCSPVIQIHWASEVPKLKRFLADTRTMLIFKVWGWRWGFTWDLWTSPHWVSDPLATLYWLLNLKWWQSHQTSVGRRHVWKGSKCQDGEGG